MAIMLMLPQSMKAQVVEDTTRNIVPATPVAETAPLVAKNEVFYIDMQLRDRGEYRNGQGTLRKKGDKPAWFIDERARVALGYKRGILSTKVSAQHSGVWGTDSLDGGRGNFSVDEAWGRIDSPRGWFLQVGRQHLSYDDERILGTEDWQARCYAHNAIRFGLEQGRQSFHGIIAFNQASKKQTGGTYYKGPMSYKNLQFLWYHFGDEGSIAQFSLMGMNRGFEIGNSKSPKTGYMQMVGGWFYCGRNGFYAKAEGYYQMGHDEKQRSVSAYMGGLRTGYDSSRWGLTVGGDYVSGQDTSDKKVTNKCFNLLYGSVHEFFGAMDYYTNTSMLYCGLIDGTARAYVNPINKLRLKADYHYFLTATKHPKLHRQLGQEIDLSIHYNILKDVTLEAGYSIMMPTSVLVYYRGGSTKSLQDWGWISINFSPRLFTFKR